jgi:hypothetical protein
VQVEARKIAFGACSATIADQRRSAVERVAPPRSSSSRPPSRSAASRRSSRRARSAGSPGTNRCRPRERSCPASCDAASRSVRASKNRRARPYSPAAHDRQPAPALGFRRRQVGFRHEAARPGSPPRWSCTEATIRSGSTRTSISIGPSARACSIAFASASPSASRKCSRSSVRTPCEHANSATRSRTTRERWGCGATRKSSTASEVSMSLLAWFPRRRFPQT